MGQGAVMSVQGLGAALSSGLGGWIAEGIGYFYTFLLLGSLAILSIGIWILFSATLNKAGNRGNHILFRNK